MNFKITPRSQHRPLKVFYRGPLPRALPSQPVADNRKLTVEELAFHESGHACVQVALRKPLWKVVINPETGAGETFASERNMFPDEVAEMRAYSAVCRDWPSAGRPSKEWVGDEMTILFAGPYAQARFNSRSSSLGWAYDLQKIGLLAGIFGDDDREFKARQLDRAADLCRKYREEIEAVAEALIERHKLSGDEVRHIVSRNSFRQSRAVDTDGIIRRDCTMVQRPLGA